MNKYKSFSLFLLRLAIAAIFLYHGLMKWKGYPSGVMGMFQYMGLPGFLGPIVAIVEVAGAILLLLGLWTNWAAYALAIVMLVATLTVDIKSGFSAGVERNILIFVGNLVLAAFGPGQWSIKKKAQKE